MGKILDGLPMSLVQSQHEQMGHQWPNPVVKKLSLILWQRTRTEYPTKMVGHIKAKFTGIADIANSEFQGQYTPIDTVQQINTANGQQVKEIIEQSITPIHVMPTPQAQKLTDSNDRLYCPTQIFQQKIFKIQMCVQSVDLPLWITHTRDLLVIIS